MKNYILNSKKNINDELEDTKKNLLNHLIKKQYGEETFESIKHIDEYNNEYWFARELQKVLEYKDWRNFKKVIDKAILSARNSVPNDNDWVVEVNKPIKTGKGKEEFVKDYKLSRYICYLIVQNADPSKEVIALGQTYFAIQTRKQEITEQEYDSLSHNEKRFYQRKLTKQGNYTLQKIASSAGVKNMAEFHNAGYRGLYNGETADDIFKRKKLRYREDILDNIVDTCNYVSNDSKHVKIDLNRLFDFAKNINGLQMQNWLYSSPFGLLENDTKLIIDFLLYFEAIDFSFWGTPKWTIKTDDGELDGSIALMYVMLKYVKTFGTNLSTLTLEEFKNILAGNSEIPLLEERFHIIKNVNKVVNQKMNGSFYEYTKNINNDKDLFQIIIKFFPNFKDERIYKGKKIYFYKLAQLLTSDVLHVKSFKNKVSVDCSHLVGCADYKIPQVLRGLGILKYDEELSNLVDNKIEILENSEFEVEIRANMINVISIIDKMLDNKYDSIDINDYIFMQKRNKKLTNKPYHLTRTINY